MCTQTPGHNKNLVTVVVSLESACGLSKLPTCAVLPVSTLFQIPPSGWGCCYVWVKTEHTNFGLWASWDTAWTPAWIWDCCTRGAHHSTVPKLVSRLAFCSFKRPISSATSHSKLQIHRSDSFQVIRKVARSMSLSYLPTLCSLPVQRKRHTHL